MPRISFALRRRSAVLLAVWGMLTLSVSTAPADGVIRDGIGAISSGRGGTNIAHADNGEILLDNPAGLVNIKGHHLYELGGAMLLTDLHYSDLQASDDAVFRPIGLPEISFIRKSRDGQWAYGLGVFAPAGFGAEYRLFNPDVGTQKYRSFGALAKVLPAVAYRMTDRLSVGGTLGLAVSHVQLQGPFYLQTVPAPLTGAPTLLDLKATGVALTWSLGLQYELSERTTVGVTYKSESRIHLYGEASADIYRDLGFGPVNSSDFDAQVDITWPRSVGLGVKHRLCDHRSFSADVIWFDWPRAFDTIGMEFSNPSNPLFAGPPIRDDLPLEWRDVCLASAGLRAFDHA